MPFKSSISKSPAGGMEIPLRSWKIFDEVDGIDARSRSAEVAKEFL